MILQYPIAVRNGDHITTILKSIENAFRNLEIQVILYEVDDMLLETKNQNTVVVPGGGVILLKKFLGNILLWTDAFVYCLVYD